MEPRAPQALNKGEADFRVLALTPSPGSPGKTGQRDLGATFPFSSVLSCGAGAISHVKAREQVGGPRAPTFSPLCFIYVFLPPSSSISGMKLVIKTI